MVIASGHEILCFAADTALACDRAVSFRIETTTGFIYVCDRHCKLAEIRAAREGLCPRLTPGWSEAGACDAAPVP